MAIYLQLIEQGWINDPENAHVKPKIVKDTGQYVENLLESARAGHRAQFVQLVAFVTPDYKYKKLIGARYKAPADWDELVVRYYKAPKVTDFQNDYRTSIEGNLQLLSAKALREKSLLLGQVVLAHYNSSESWDSDRWRREIGVNFMTEITKMVEQLQVERQLIFT